METCATLVAPCPTHLLTLPEHLSKTNANPARSFPDEALVSCDVMRPGMEAMNVSHHLRGWHLQERLAV